MPTDIPSPFRSFRIYFPKSERAYNPKLAYEVLVFVPSSGAQNAPIKLKKSIKVAGLFKVEMRRVGDCEGIRMEITTPLRGNSSIWNPIYQWLEQFPPGEEWRLASVKVRVVGSPNEVEYRVSNIVWKKNPDFQAAAGVLAACLEFDKSLPSKDFGATFEFHGPNLPTEITTVKGEDLSGVFKVDYPKNEDVAAPEDRKLEQNLDLGITFTTSVADETTPASGSTPAVTVRKRTSRGVLDVRFAPWLNILPTGFETNAWLTYLTPIYLNANVATGKIDKDTLGLNRVLIGLEGESRYIVEREITYYNPCTKENQRKITDPVVHRLIWGFTHASDRDFKQKEFTSKLEYNPLIDAIYKPYPINYKRDCDGYKHQRPYGFTVLPVVGAEIGRTYSRHNPASVIEPSDTVRRFYFGGEIALDLTAYVTLSAKDFFYVRGENPQDHFKNYFKGSAEFRLGKSRNGQFAHSLFMVFERGQQPPFASPDVNSFRIGYRIQGSYCGSHCR